MLLFAPKKALKSQENLSHPAEIKMTESLHARTSYGTTNASCAALGPDKTRKHTVSSGLLLPKKEELVVGELHNMLLSVCTVHNFDYQEENQHAYARWELINARSRARSIMRKANNLWLRFSFSAAFLKRFRFAIVN
jgi:hypothetical protein